MASSSTAGTHSRMLSKRPSQREDLSAAVLFDYNRIRKLTDLHTGEFPYEIHLPAEGGDSGCHSPRFAFTLAWGPTSIANKSSTRSVLMTIGKLHQRVHKTFLTTGKKPRRTVLHNDDSLVRLVFASFCTMKFLYRAIVILDNIGDTPSVQTSHEPLPLAIILHDPESADFLSSCRTWAQDMLKQHENNPDKEAVSYTHLTLPTICSV